MIDLEGGRPSPTPSWPISAPIRDRGLSTRPGRWAASRAYARTRLPGTLGVAAGALFCIGLGVVMARSAGLTPPLSAAGIGNSPATRELVTRPARLVAAPIPGPTHGVPPAVKRSPPVLTGVTVKIMPAALPPGWSCAAAVHYLDAHAAPGFSFVCPGFALGHQAMTCDNVSGVCPGQKVIVIAVPCPAAYENEAWNSRVLENLASGPLDPFGYCRR